MKNKLFAIGALFACLALTAACGSSTSSGGGGDTPSITTISALPTATSPMASSASAMVAKDAEKAATTGLKFASTSSADFSATSSMGACETFNVAKDAVSSAAQADMILCYVKQMNDAFGETTDASGNHVDIYDGEWHIFNLNITGAEEGSPDKVKMRIVKNSAGSITSFQMFMCKLAAGGALEQNEYTDQTISGTSFAMSGKGNHGDADWSGSHEVDVTGTLNSSGVFTQRAIAMRNTGGNVDGSNSNWQETTFEQTPGEFLLHGYRYGTYTDPQYGSSSSQEGVYGVGQMLGDTSTSLANLAMGDGAVNVDGYYAWTSMGPGDPGHYDASADVKAWLGDGALPVDPATDSSYYADAHAGTIPTVVTSEISIAFTAAETWDCSDDEATALTMPAMDEATLEAACAQYSLGHDWINCYQQIQPNQQ